jgi:peptidoglycan/xylan/chitin deacetylase (PgdA/CDA1 family)
MIRRLVDSAIFHGTRVVAPLLFTGPRASVRGAYASFTFDDFPRSARTCGARLLEERGVLGTFYVAMALVTDTPTDHEGFSADDLRELARRGHEIGCHTHTHLDCFPARDGRILRDVASNAEAVARLLPGTSLRHFAFPYGRLRPSHKRLLGTRFATLRTIFPGVHRGEADLRLLRANKLFSTGSLLRRARELIDDVAAHGGWVIFFTHDVSSTPSAYGVRPRDLDDVVAHAQRRGIEILPVGHVVSRLVAAPRACLMANSR